MAAVRVVRHLDQSFIQGRHMRQNPRHAVVDQYALKGSQRGYASILRVIVLDFRAGNRRFVFVVEGNQPVTVLSQESSGFIVLHQIDQVSTVFDLCSILF